ncbi:MAG TPA: hypothetical protein PLC79_01790, partial [Phycisphaerae bacterium]|nr:hypothetical protein [Phycisphaerae bacterium]
MGYVAQEIRSEEEFAAIRDEWQALLAISPANTIFLTWEWLFEWWRSYGGGRALRGLLLRDEAGRPAAGALLMTDAVRIPLAGPVRALRFVGDGSFDSDYLDIV